jgi:hypothetical protein
MRSGSTLLTHILCSNPKITGFAETLLRYESSRQFDELVHLTSTVRRRILVRPYIMDKVLHNDFLLDQVFQNQRCRFIFLLREPAGAMQSHVRRWIEQNKYPNLGQSELQKVVYEHYSKRLATIERDALAVSDPGRRAFLTHDELVNRTGLVFGMLEDFLELDTPLSEKYSLWKVSGHPVVGDASPFIKKGFIDRSIQHESTVFDPAMLEAATELYTRLVVRLKSLCRSLPPASTQSLDPALAAQSDEHSR